MPTMIQDLYEEITSNLGNLKTDKDNDQVIIKNYLKMIHCLSYDVYNNNIDMDFLNKVEVFKQYRQSVMNSENNDFFGSLIHEFQRLKLMTFAIVYFKKSRIFV